MPTPEHGACNSASNLPRLRVLMIITGVWYIVLAAFNDDGVICELDIQVHGLRYEIASSQHTQLLLCYYKFPAFETVEFRQSTS